MKKGEKGRRVSRSKSDCKHRKIEDSDDVDVHGGETVNESAEEAEEWREGRRIVELGHLDLADELRACLQVL